jgi:hypothetical protein
MDTQVDTMMKPMDDVPDEEKIDESRIPDLMKIGQIPTSYGQTLTTDVIDPVTFSQNSVRFTLQRVAGFLHSNSKVTLAVTPKTNARAFYPLNIGISSLIKSAQLLVGNKQICSIEDYGEYHAYQSMFLTNENNKEREQFLSQRCINHEPVYEDLVFSADADDTPNSASRYGLSLGRTPVIGTGDGSHTFQLLPFQIHDATSAATIAEAPVYSVYLSDLFPFLKTNQLPAFMIDEEIHIDITFQDKISSLSGAANSVRMCQQETGGTVGVEYDITQDQVKLVYDSISYDGAVMAQYAAENPKLVFQYEDYRLAKRTGAAAAFSNLTFAVGGNGRLVSKVFFGLQPDANKVAKSMCNGYVAAAPTDNRSKLTTNLLYNDRYLFSVDRSNDSQLFQTTAHAEGQIPMISRDEYYNAGEDVPGQANSRSGLTAATFEGHDQQLTSAGLGGNFRWTAFRLNRAERVNNKGIDLVYKNTVPGGNYTLRVWLEMLKVATIENGRMECYFA